MASKLLRGFLSVVSGRFGTLFLGILITPILVRMLGSDGYGDYAFITALLGVTTTLTAVGGVTSGVRKFMVEDRDIKQWDSHVFAFYLRFAVAMVAVAGVVIIAYAWSGLAEAQFGTEFVVYFYLLAAMAVTDQLYQLVRATLMGMSKEHLSEPLSVAKKGVYGLVALSLVYYGAGVSGALTGRVAGAAAAAIGCTLFLIRYLDFKTITKPSPPSFPRKELLSFNFASLLLLFFMTSLYQVDVILLQPLSGSSEAGIYKSALVIAEFLWFVPHAAQLVLLHSMSELWASDDTAAISERVSTITRYTLLFTTLLVVGLASLAEPFIRLYYGPEFVAAVLPLLLLLPGTLGFALTRPILSTSQASGQIRPLVIATGTAATINLVLNLLLIPFYGIVGAAIATSVGYGSMFVFHVITARRIGFDPLHDLRVGRVAISGIVTAVVVFPLAGTLSGIFVPLLVVPPVGFVVFLVAAVTTSALTDSEVAAAKAEIEHRLGSFDPLAAD